MKASVGGISSDRVCNLSCSLLFALRFHRGCAGFGSPVAIAGAFMIGLGFKPFTLAALNLIANTGAGGLGSDRHPVHHARRCPTLLPEPT